MKHPFASILISIGLLLPSVSYGGFDFFRKELPQWKPSSSFRLIFVHPKTPFRVQTNILEASPEEKEMNLLLESLVQSISKTSLPMAMAFVKSQASSRPLGSMSQVGLLAGEAGRKLLANVRTSLSDMNIKRSLTHQTLLVPWDGKQVIDPYYSKNKISLSKNIQPDFLISEFSEEVEEGIAKSIAAYRKQVEEKMDLFLQTPEMEKLQKEERFDEMEVPFFRPLGFHQIIHVDAKSQSFVRVSFLLLLQPRVFEFKKVNDRIALVKGIIPMGKDKTYPVASINFFIPLTPGQDGKMGKSTMNVRIGDFKGIKKGQAIVDGADKGILLYGFPVIVKKGVNLNLFGNLDVLFSINSLSFDLEKLEMIPPLGIKMKVSLRTVAPFLGQIGSGLRTLKPRSFVRHPYYHPFRKSGFFHNDDVQKDFEKEISAAIQSEKDKARKRAEENLSGAEKELPDALGLVMQLLGDSTASTGGVQ